MGDAVFEFGCRKGRNTPGREDSLHKGLEAQQDVNAP